MRCPLEGKIPKDNHRYHTFQHALQLLAERKAQVLVETGTSRSGARNFISDGCSTLIYAEWAHSNNATLYSVDIDEWALLAARSALNDFEECVYLVEDDSVNFLEQFNKKIDFLYQDSVDFYVENPMPSQEHHLKEIKAAYPWLAEESIVMIDDCDLPFGGKGKLVIEYLLARGWKIAARSYQVILTRT